MKALLPDSGAPAPDDFVRAWRLWLARRGRRVTALQGSDDPVVLSRLGLHASAARGFDVDPQCADRWASDAIASYFAVDRREDAARLADKADRGAGSVRRALALAPYDLARALRAAPVSNRDLVAALGGRAVPETAQGRLASGGGGPSDWAGLFAERGMTPVSGGLDAPLTLDNATATSQVVTDGELVSVVMPVWNTAGHIGPAVRSALGQGWRNLELLVVDDGSDDGSVDRAIEAAAGDPRLIILRQDRRKGPYVARNRAMSVARGRWLAFHDADEWAHPDRLRTQVAEMTRRGLVASAGRSVRLDDAGRPRARGYWPLVRFAPSTMMIDRDRVLSRVGLMNEVWSGADNEYWWRMMYLFGPRRVATLPHLLILGAWRAASQTVSASEGYGDRGVNLNRLAYWEAWNRWHVAERRHTRRMKLGPGDQRFEAPLDLIVDRVEGAA